MRGSLNALRLCTRMPSLDGRATADEVTPRVDSKSLVTIKQNRYSVPVRLAGLRIHARVGAREIECRHSGELVAVHERQQGRFGISASLDHYLELLARKPGALAGSLALSQERERGTWPSAFDELWGKITERYGSSEAARQMIDVLLLAREHSAGEVEQAVRGALTAGAHDGRAVAVLCSRGVRVEPPALDDLPLRLQGLGAPPPTLGQYDELLDGGEAMSAPAQVQAMETLIEAHAVELKLPTVRARFRTLAEEAIRDQQTPTAYLAALLEAEVCRAR